MKDSLKLPHNEKLIIPKRKNKSEYVMCRITSDMKERFDAKIAEDKISQQAALEFLIQFYLGE